VGHLEWTARRAAMPLCRLALAACHRPSTAARVLQGGGASQTCGGSSCEIRPHGGRTLVSCESESALQYSFPSSRSSGFTHTCSR
jgi:hypothetical protein